MTALPGIDRGPLALLALPVSKTLRAELGQRDMYHRAPQKYRKLICAQPRLPDAGVRTDINLVAASGWQMESWKLIRDLTVVDLNLSLNASHGFYLYFFVGLPSGWNKRANAGETRKSNGADIYRIKGADLLSRCETAFYRSIDKVLVIRGNYSGPAFAKPDTPT